MTVTNTALLAVLAILACGRRSAPAADAADPAGVRDGVGAMAEGIARDLARDGPGAWLRYFARSPGFFMASDGRVVLPGHDSAVTFVHDLATKMRRMELTWGDLRIDSLAPGLASLGAPFHELLVDSAGSEVRIAGYFTGVAERVDSGWRLRNAHWSLEGPSR